MPRPYIPPEYRESIFGPNWREMQAMNNRQRAHFKQLLGKKLKNPKQILVLLGKIDKNKLANVPKVPLNARKVVNLDYISQEDTEEIKGKHIAAIEWMHKMVTQGNPIIINGESSSDSNYSFKIKYQTHLLKIWYDKSRMPLAEFTVFCEYIDKCALGMKVYRDLIARCSSIISQFQNDQENEILRNMAKRVKKLQPILQKLKERSENIKWNTNGSLCINKIENEKDKIRNKEENIHKIIIDENQDGLELGD